MVPEEECRELNACWTNAVAFDLPRLVRARHFAAFVVYFLLLVDCGAQVHSDRPCLPKEPCIVPVAKWHLTEVLGTASQGLGKLPSKSKLCQPPTAKS